jgi:hypothetical protein
MKKTWRKNKRKNTRTYKKRKYMAKVIKLDNKGTTAILFHKTVPKKVIKNIMKKIDKSEYVELCQEHKNIKKSTKRKKRKQRKTKVLKGGGAGARLAELMAFPTRFASVGSELVAASGPVGSIARGISSLFTYGGGMTGFLVVGASAATIIYAMKQSGVNIKPEYEQTDYVKIFEDHKATCDPSSDKADLTNAKCTPPIVGTNNARKKNREQAEKDLALLEKKTLLEAENQAMTFAPMAVPAMPMKSGNP